MITHVLGHDLPADTIGGLFDWRLRTTPDAPFARCGDEAVTYRQAGERVDLIERGLAGLEPGERVAVVAANSITHLAISLACARRGVIWAPVNISLGSDDLAYTLTDLEPRLVFADQEHLAAVDHLAADRVVAIGGDDDGLAEWIARSGTSAGELEPVGTGAGDAFCIMYSGGTTGRPKGVILPHFAAVSCAMRLAEVAEWNEHETFYSASHLFHAYLPCAIVPFCMLNGFEVVFDAWFSASAYFERVRACAATVIDPFIGMVGALLAQPESELDTTHGVRLAVSGFGGADPNSLALRKRFEERFAIATYQPYGQTEAGGFIAVETEHDERRLGSCGRIGDWYDVQIVDDDGFAQPAGEVGELQVRPRVPHVMAHGYLNRAEETLANWRNLWVHTGDRCMIDADGYLWFVGRAGHFMRRRGELVSIGEVEMILGEHPEVAETAVVAVPSEMGEDDGRCSVVLVAGSSITAPDLIAWADGRLAKFKIPRYFEIVDALPRTAAKSEIDRGALAGRGTEMCFDREAGR